MTVFENIKSMNIDEFTEWFEKNCMHDEDPVIKWWDKNYCSKCEPEIVPVEGYYHKKEMDICWCELHNKCKFFKNMDKTPSNKDMIKLWLESECK